MKAENTEIHAIANRVDMVKLLPICIYPTYKNGRLINITSTLNDIPDNLLAIKAIPTTPPSIR